MELPKIEFHSVVEVVDLIAGLMTIIGISGVVTWSLTSSNKLADGIAGFAAHCLRITIFIFLLGRSSGCGLHYTLGCSCDSAVAALAT